VLTKLDIMDRGTDAAAALRNEVVPLRLGYVGVVLRSQEDIAARRAMAESRAAERAFFDSRAEYAGVAAACGVGTLAAALNAILVENIRDMLPTLRGRLEAAAGARRRELRLYGDAPPGSSSAARGAALLAILDSYATRFGALLDGHGEHLPITELAGGARVRHIFQEIFTAGLDGLQPTGELTDEDVRTAIKNSGGIKGSLLIPEAPFELLVRRAIDRLLPPALQCKDFVHAELVRIAAASAPPDVARFPVLQKVLGEAVEEFIAAGAGPAEHMIRNLVACELAYINTSHPRFIGGNRAIAAVLERRAAAGTLGGSSDDEGGAGAAAAARGGGGGAGGGALPAVDGLAAAAKMSLRGVEPELFRPEELLPSREREGSGNVTPRTGDAGRGGWLSNWFGRGGGGEGGDAGDGQAPDSVLRRPPPVRFAARAPHLALSGMPLPLLYE
jgi:dynamin 1-like protein